MNQPKYNSHNIFHKIIMLRCAKTKVVKEEFYGVKKPIKIWDVNVDNVIISKLVETKKNFKNLTGYLDEVIKPLVLLLPKMNGYVKAFKDESKNNKNNTFMSLSIADVSY